MDVLHKVTTSVGKAFETVHDAINEAQEKVQKVISETYKLVTFKLS